MLYLLTVLTKICMFGLERIYLWRGDEVEILISQFVLRRKKRERAVSLVAQIVLYVYK